MLFWLGALRWMVGILQLFNGLMKGFFDVLVMAVHEQGILEDILHELAQLAVIFVEHLELFNAGDGIAVGLFPSRFVHRSWGQGAEIGGKWVLKKV